MTQQQLAARLEQLKQEFEKGQTALTELQNQQTELQQQLLRISGAMQVLQELLDGATEEQQD